MAILKLPLSEKDSITLCTLFFSLTSIESFISLSLRISLTASSKYSSYIPVIITSIHLNELTVKYGVILTIVVCGAFPSISDPGIRAVKSSRFFKSLIYLLLLVSSIPALNDNLVSISDVSAACSADIILSICENPSLSPPSIFCFSFFSLSDVFLIIV